MMPPFHPRWSVTSLADVTRPLALDACGDGAETVLFYALSFALVAIATAIAARIWFSGWHVSSRRERMRQLALFVAGGFAWVVWTAVATSFFVLFLALLGAPAYSSTNVGPVAMAIAIALSTTAILAAVAIPAVAVLQSRMMTEHLRSVAGSGPSESRIALMTCHAVSGSWLPLTILLVINAYYILGDPCASLR